MKPATLQTLYLLRKHPEGVSALTALDEIGSFRLGARVFELREAGYVIERKWKETYSGKRIAVYVLHEKPEQQRLAI